MATSSPVALRRLRPAALIVGASSLLAGCAGQSEANGLPSQPGVTNHTGRIIDLWNYSWLAAIVVGVITLALILWAVTVYRKKKGDEKLPMQTRANVPLELMYVAVPLLMIAVLFRWTATDVAAIKDLSDEPDVRIQAIGKQWAWDFNYLDDDVYSVGVQARLTGEEGVEETLPVLYLPVDELVDIQLDSRDVIHSFWVPAFLVKQDLIPGRTSHMQFIPQQVGTYQGKCAELCGEYHSAMLFNVKVVPREEYDAYIQSLRDAGQTGSIGLEYNRLQDVDVQPSGEEG
ncbi:cytochrome c oxidase subunit II [Demequina sp.]|uniref:aa3-type cytochrome oxidase subunit II n=1 Tax=Demequina sp. TaxID=2050685 RepID=UPI0025B7F4F8|nr:cytochrome c oxidase subunit II [Demequina sp.]